MVAVAVAAMSDRHRRFVLYRWWKRTQLDIHIGGAGFVCVGVDRRAPRWATWVPWRAIAYYSPDATPMHPRARGWKGWGG